MSNKQNSTISAKPEIDPALQWIGNTVSETPATAATQQANKPASKHVNMQTSQQANAAEHEPTAMLSARVPVALIRKLRIRAATEGRPIQEIIADLLRGYLEGPDDE